jgi:hypothetical protein
MTPTHYQKIVGRLADGVVASDERAIAQVRCV